MVNRGECQLNNANQLGNTTAQYDCSKEEERFTGIGETNQRRSLFIAFPLRRHSDEVLIRPISARYMHPKEVDHYEKEITKI